MRVSVIMPVYNAAATIGAALDSVLRQGQADYEIIVIDDGSDDGGAEISAGYPGVHIVAQANGGPAAARNSGLALCSGDVIAFLDADDLWPDGSLAARLAVLSQRPGLAAVHGQIRDLWPDGRLGEPRRGFNLGSALFRRAALKQVGGFNPALRLGEDVDFWLRLAQGGGQRQAIADVTLLYRRREAPDPRGAQPYYSRLLRNLKQSMEANARRDEKPAGPDHL